MKHGSAWALACLLFIACNRTSLQGAGTPHASAAHPGKTTTPTAAPTGKNSASGVLPSSGNVDVAQPDPSAPPHLADAVIAGEPALHLVLDGFDALNRVFFGVRHGAPFFVAGWGSNRHVISRSEPNVLFARDVSLLRGLPADYGLSINGFFGGLEEGALLNGYQSSGRIGLSKVFRRGADGWDLVIREKEGVSYVAVQAWTGGRFLAYLSSSIPMKSTGSKYGFKIVAGPRKGVVVPKVKMTAPRPDDMWGPTPVVGASTFAAFQSGCVIVIGSDKYEYFAPGATQGVIGSLPSKTRQFWGRADAAKHGDNEVLVTLEKGPAYFDGKSWTLWPLPGDAQANRVERHDGHWWAANSKQLYKRVDDQWRSVLLPPPGSDEHREIIDIRSSEKALWVLGSSSIRTLRGMRKKQQLWSTAAPAHGVQVLAPAKEDEPGFAARSSDSLKSVHAQASHPVKAQPGCKHLYALFFGISSQSKPAYDFPLTRKALRGHAEFSAARFVKTKDNGRLFFGAFVDDYQTGEKLVRLVRSKLQHAKPQLLCHKPKVVAELRVDLSTGASLGWAKARRSP